MLTVHTSRLVEQTTVSKHPRLWIIVHEQDEREDFTRRLLAVRNCYILAQCPEQQCELGATARLGYILQSQYISAYHG